MRIANWDIREKNDRQEVSADIDGFRLWYRVPKGHPVSRSGDPFLAAALLPAMARGEGLEMDPALPVSPKLVQGLSHLQVIHHSWNPALKIIPISAAASSAVPLHPGAMSFFSGGVDSMFTFLKRREDLSHLVFIQGFDFYTNDGDVPEFSIADIGDLAQLAHKLMKPWGAVSGFVKSRLPESTLRALSEFVETGSGPALAEKALATDLDRIINQTHLYDRRRFAGIHLRRETIQGLDQVRAGESPGRLNRLLLEDAFPLEISRRGRTAYETAIARNTEFATEFGKALVPVSTNHFPFGYRYNLSRNLTQGSALASVALLLGFSRAYIPAAYSYSQLIPLGSHPLMDPLWSTEGVTIVHDGAEARRVDKVVRIAGNPAALANLRVCFADMNVNCGQCAKCLRTLVPLHFLGASNPPFPSSPDPSRLRALDIPNEIEKIFFMENYDLAVRTDLAESKSALRAALRRYERKMLLKAVDRVLLGGGLKKGSRKRAKEAAGIRRIDTTPPQG